MNENREGESLPEITIIATSRMSHHVLDDIVDCGVEVLQMSEKEGRGGEKERTSHMRKSLAGRTGCSRERGERELLARTVHLVSPVHGKMRVGREQ